jgi:acetylornithine deacetylase/succinyl-diaminopimelate desuccinylase-like protein
MSDAALLQLAETASESSLALYRDLLRIPSVWGDAPRLSEAADFLAGELRDAGLDVELPESGTDGMPMVLARLRGRAGGPSLLLAGHMEVYPPSESWELDPWGATVRDGRVYGQGAADMKGGTAGMTAAAVILGRNGVELPGDLVLLAVPNHFEGGEGTRKALRDGLEVDAAIVCEPTGLAVVTGQRGILYLTITVHGRAAHTTALDIGVNAIERAARIIEALYGLAASAASDVAPIVNVAMIVGGVVHNLVPERCRLTVDIRFAPEQTADEVLGDVREAIASVLGDDELGTSVEPEATCVRNPRSSLRLPDGHPLPGWLAIAHEDAGGGPASLGFHPAWPDTPILNEAGIPAITYGPGSMECYWDDEWVEVDEYLTAVRTYCLAAVRKRPLNSPRR